MDNVVEVVENVVEAQAPVNEAPAVEKVDNRKGKRRVDHADGTRSYGLKADGTPRSKPGRRPNPPKVVVAAEAPVEQPADANVA